MKKLILLGVIIIFLITLVGTGTVMAMGPHKAVGKNPNAVLYPSGDGTCTLLITKGGTLHSFWDFNPGTPQYLKYGPRLHTICLTPDKAPGWDLSEDRVFYWSYGDVTYICKQCRAE